MSDQCPSCKEPTVTWTLSEFNAMKVKIRKEAEWTALLNFMDLTEKAFSGSDFTHAGLNEFASGENTQNRLRKWLATMVDTGKEWMVNRAANEKRRERSVKRKKQLCSSSHCNDPDCNGTHGG